MQSHRLKENAKSASFQITPIVSHGACDYNYPKFKRLVCGRTGVTASRVTCN